MCTHMREMRCDLNEGKFMGEVTMRCEVYMPPYTFCIYVICTCHVHMTHTIVNYICYIYISRTYDMYLI